MDIIFIKTTDVVHQRRFKWKSSKQATSNVKIFNIQLIIFIGQVAHIFKLLDPYTFYNTSKYCACANFRIENHFYYRTWLKFKSKFGDENEKPKDIRERESWFVVLQQLKSSVPGWDR